VEFASQGFWTVCIGRLEFTAVWISYMYLMQRQDFYFPNWHEI
jgi:hypothetical protein